MSSHMACHAMKVPPMSGPPGPSVAETNSPPGPPVAEQTVPPDRW